MEAAALVLQRSAVLHDVALAEGDEVFDGFRHSCTEHVDDDVSCRSAADVDGEDDLVGDRFLSGMGATLSRPQRERTSRVARRTAFDI